MKRIHVSQHLGFQISGLNDCTGVATDRITIAR